MRAVFISYRRDDSEGQAGRLYDDLVRQFGDESVFMDVAGIEPGLDFRKVIDKNVSSCGVLLALIGPSWLDAKDETGQRRLDNPLDFVRLETASALKRDIPVVPVLVGKARMPRPEKLPEDLKELAYRNGVELTHARWDSDLQVLVKALQRLTENLPPEPPNVAKADPAPDRAVEKTTTQAANVRKGVSPSPPRMRFIALIAGVIVLLALVAIGWMVLRRKPPVVLSVSPDSGFVSGGSGVIIHGSHFSGVSRVSFGATNASIASSVSTDTVIEATQPPSSSSAGSRVPIVVCTSAGCSAPDRFFSYLPLPNQRQSSSQTNEQSVPSPVINFAGDWQEVSPVGGPLPRQLTIKQDGLVVSVFFGSYRAFGGTVSDGKFTYSATQGCGPQFQKPGYDYTNPGLNTYVVSLRGSMLIYEQDTQWTSPCDGHPIGIEKNVKEFRRVSSR